LAFFLIGSAETAACTAGVERTAATGVVADGAPALLIEAGTDFLTEVLMTEDGAADPEGKIPPELAAFSVLLVGIGLGAVFLDVDFLFCPTEGFFLMVLLGSTTVGVSSGAFIFFFVLAAFTTVLGFVVLVVLLAMEVADEGMAGIGMLVIGATIPVDFIFVTGVDKEACAFAAATAAVALAVAATIAALAVAAAI